MTHEIYVHGYGAVSAAGLSSKALYEAAKSDSPLESETVTYPLSTVEGHSKTFLSRPVDKKSLRGVLPRAPRLRRSSNVTKFSMAAALQALPPDRLEKSQAGQFRLGIILAFMNGCVNYSSRFFGEVLDEPAHASPMIFPETVFNAPASHVASHLGCDGPCYTLIGDSSTWFSAIQTGSDWLHDDLVDGCLVLAAEELDHLTSEALSLYSRKLTPTEGAAAIYFESSPSKIQLSGLHGPFSYTDRKGRRDAVAKARSALSSDSLIVDSLTGVHKIDRDELSTVEDLTRKSLSPFINIGEAMGLRAGFQSVIALEALTSDEPRTSVLSPGNNQHAFSATFDRLD